MIKLVRKEGADRQKERMNVNSKTVQVQVHESGWKERWPGLGRHSAAFSDS